MQTFCRTVSSVVFTYDPYEAYCGAIAQPKPVEHKYRFERNGASLWRYDETSGEACQLESNVANND